MIEGDENFLSIVTKRGGFFLCRNNFVVATPRSDGERFFSLQFFFRGL